ncbi:hypothetical protein ACFV3E_24695 [Streptomyces sp. NPDC059718]
MGDSTEPQVANVATGRLESFKVVVGKNLVEGREDEATLRRIAVMGSRRPLDQFVRAFKFWGPLSVINCLSLSYLLPSLPVVVPAMIALAGAATQSALQVVWLRNPTYAVTLISTALRMGRFERRLERWAEPLITLGGTALFLVPALVFPPRFRRPWLAGILESFAYRREEDLSFWRIVTSFVATWPSNLLRDWSEWLNGTDPNLMLEGRDQEGAQSLQGKRPGWFRRHGGEIGWAAVFGLVLLVLCEIGKAFLHSRGLVYPWDVWFTAAEH